MPRKQLSLRAVATGALLSLGISVFFAWARLGMATAGMSADYITAAAIFFFFVLTAAINPLLKLVRLSWGFDRSELIVIYIMMIVASAIPTWGFTANLIALLPSVFYYATPENEWARLLHPHVTEWLVPQDPEAIRYFFEGLPGQPIPWSAWMTPLLAWVSFILSIYLMMITIMIIMRRHWVEHDRLTFPLLQLPMDMAEEGEPGSKLTPFVKQPLMWVGFALPFLLLSTSALNHYYPFIGNPEISLRHSVPLFGGHGLPHGPATTGSWSADSLKQVSAKITRDEGALDDGDELLSYRAAAVVLTLSALYATGWLTAAGVPLPVSHRCHADDELDLVQRIPRMGAESPHPALRRSLPLPSPAAPESPHPALRRSLPLPSPAAPVSGAHPRARLRVRFLGDVRLRHRRDGERDPRLLI